MDTRRLLQAVGSEACGMRHNLGRRDLTEAVQDTVIMRNILQISISALPATGSLQVAAMDTYNSPRPVGAVQPPMARSSCVTAPGFADSFTQHQYLQHMQPSVGKRVLTSAMFANRSRAYLCKAQDTSRRDDGLSLRLVNVRQAISAQWVWTTLW